MDYSQSYNIKEEKQQLTYVVRNLDLYLMAIVIVDLIHYNYVIMETQILFISYMETLQNSISIVLLRHLENFN